jgi:hypothetical protein
MARKKGRALIPLERIEKKILIIRGQKVLLDSDLAELYEVTTFNLNKAVRRNHERFPEDFMFQLNNQEFADLKFQIGIANSGRGGRRTPPYCFTEMGVAMLSSVLGSKRAISVNIEIMRTFTRLRELLASHVELSRRIQSLERVSHHHAGQLEVVFEAIRELSAPPPAATKKGHKLGF